MIPNLKLDFNKKKDTSLQDLVAQIVGLNDIQEEKGPTIDNAISNRDYLSQKPKMPEQNMQSVIQNLIKVSSQPKQPPLPHQGPTIDNAMNIPFKQEERTFEGDIADPNSNVNKLYPMPKSQDSPINGLSEALKKGDWGSVFGNTLKYLGSGEGTPILGAFTSDPYQKGAYSDISLEKKKFEQLDKESLNKQIADRAKALLDLSSKYQTQDFEKQKQKTDQDFKEKELGIRVGEARDEKEANRKSRELIAKNDLEGRKLIAEMNAQVRRDSDRQRKEDKQEVLDTKKEDTKKASFDKKIEPFNRIQSLLDSLNDNIDAGITIPGLSAVNYATSSIPGLKTNKQVSFNTARNMASESITKDLSGRVSVPAILLLKDALPKETDSLENRKAAMETFMNIYRGLKHASLRGELDKGDIEALDWVEANKDNPKAGKVIEALKLKGIW